MGSGGSEAPDSARPAGRILVVDDEPQIRGLLARDLRGAGYAVEVAASAEDALAAFSAFGPGLVIADVHMPGLSGLDLVDRLRHDAPAVDAIVITGMHDMATAIQAMKRGAYDYLTKPFHLEDVRLSVDRCFRDRRNRRRIHRLTTEIAAAHHVGEMVGRSPGMVELFKLAGRLAELDTPVLIRGETGTGKELIARAIHYNSARAPEPFVAVNCAALPDSLLEAELFGHTRGAFTGAVQERRGRFEQAGAGTIFLDEVADTSPAFQAKLLRVLQEHEYYRVGGERLLRVEARILAATHRLIEEMVRGGEFREDLFYRLRVVELTVPPLRERREDIPLLAGHLLARVCARIGSGVRVIPDAVMSRLQEYPWPGNVRELEHALTRAAVVARGPAIGFEHLGLGSGGPGPSPGSGDALPFSDDRSLEAIQRAHVQAILREVGGNKRRAARTLRVSRSRLDRLIARFGLAVPERDRDGPDS